MTLDPAHASETVTLHHQAGIVLESRRNAENEMLYNTWRRDLEADTTKIGYTWKQLKRMTRDKRMWRYVVGVLYPDKDQVHKYVSKYAGVRKHERVDRLVGRTFLEIEPAKDMVYILIVI